MAKWPDLQGPLCAADAGADSGSVGLACPPSAILKAVRVWDVDPSCLCRRHLLGEHGEVHAVWSVLTQAKRGYADHPETNRWRGKLAALYKRHALIEGEMERRDYRHKTPLDASFATGDEVQEAFVTPPEEQMRLLSEKPCECPLANPPATPGEGARRAPPGSTGGGRRQ